MGYVNITVKDGKHSWNYKVESCIKLGLWNYSPRICKCTMHWASSNRSRVMTPCQIANNIIKVRKSKHIYIPFSQKLKNTLGKWLSNINIKSSKTNPMNIGLSPYCWLWASACPVGDIKIKFTNNENEPSLNLLYNWDILLLRGVLTLCETHWQWIDFSSSFKW